MVEEFAATLALTAVAVHTQQSHLSDGPHPSHTHLELVILPPSCISSRKTLWTASASLRSGSLESPALSLASFCLFLRSCSLFLKSPSLAVEVNAITDEKGPAHSSGDGAVLAHHLLSTKEPGRLRRGPQRSRWPRSLAVGAIYVSVLPTFSSKSLIVSSLAFRSVINF